MREKKLRDRRVGLLVLVMAAFLSLVGASDPLNPLVVRTDSAQAPVPVECGTGLSLAPSLRVDLRDIPLPEPEPAEAVAPPSGALRGSLVEVQTALASNNRGTFDDALARARSLTEAHPRGGERRAAEELVRIYEGARRLWDAQYQSPFFGEDSTEYAIASAYPGYAEAMRRNILTDAAGNRFYPAAESRAFLTGVAADRLKGLGVRSPARAPRPDRAATATDDEERPLPAIRPRTTASAGSTSSGRSTRSTSGRSTRSTSSGRSTRSTSGTSRPRSTSAGTAAPSRSTSAATGSASRPTSTPSSAPARKPAVVTSTPSSPNPSAPPTTTAVPKPAAPPVAESTTPATASSPAAGESSSSADGLPPAIDQPTETAPATDTTPFTDTTPATDTTLTTAPVTTTTAPAAPVPADTRPLRSRSVVLPTILILIGLAVLIVLFRASK